MNVLIGIAAGAVGILLGALLERWRDYATWRRQEEVRWLTDLRVVYRDLLANGDRVWRLGTVYVDDKLPKVEADPPVSAEKGRETWDSAIKPLLDSMLEYADAYEPIAVGRAEVDLIASDDERSAVARYAEAVLGLTHTDSTVEGWREGVEKEYEDARANLIGTARVALRKGERRWLRSAA